jgi:hypothetical protein
MRNFLLTSAAVAALLGGVAVAEAQMTPGARGPAAEAAQNEPGAGKANREREPRARGGEQGAAPAVRDRQSSTPSPRGATTGQGSDREFDRPRSERRRGEADEQRRSNERKQSQDDRRDGDRNRAARDRDGDRDRNAAERNSQRERATGQSANDRDNATPRRGDAARSDTTRDRAGQRQENRQDRRQDSRQSDSRGDRFRMTSEQRIRISTRFSDRIDRMNVRPLSRNSISVSIGAVVPRSVNLHVVPQDIVAIYPRFRGHRFVVVEEEIVIIEPRSYRVVAVLPMSGGRQARASVRETTASAPARARLQLSPQERETIRTVVMREPACRLEQRVDFFLFVPIPRTVEICELPREVVSTVPAVGAYRYALRGDDIVLVDPEDHRVVEIIE